MSIFVSNDTGKYANDQNDIHRRCGNRTSAAKRRTADPCDQQKEGPMDIHIDAGQSAEFERSMAQLGLGNLIVKVPCSRNVTTKWAINVPTIALEQTVASRPTGTSRIGGAIHYNWGPLPRFLGFFGHNLTGDAYLR